MTFGPFTAPADRGDNDGVETPGRATVRGTTSDGGPRGPGHRATRPTTAPRGAPVRGERRPRRTRRERVGTAIARLVDAINRSDDNAVEQAVLQLSSRRRWLAPLALVVGAFLMLFQGLKLLVTNWRLTLVQIVPAMWIWARHARHQGPHPPRQAVPRDPRPVLIPAVLAVTGLTAASFYLNGVFAFAISEPGKPEIRPAFGQARRHLRVILAWGCGIGFALSFSALIVTRWGHWPFAISQSIVVGIMMLCYVAVPARIVGIEQEQNTRDKLAATAVGGAVGRRRVLAALHAGTARHPDAGLALPLLVRHHPHRHRRHAADRRHQRREGGEVLGQAGRAARAAGPPARRP